MRYDPLVFDRKTVFMQRIADQVRRGYRWYALGEVRLDRAKALVAKFARLYNVHLHRNQKLRERASGVASADLLLWQPHTETIVFCLLVTPGPHEARSMEKLQDAFARDARLTLGDCELVQRPRTGSDRASWTWRLTVEAYEGWRLRALEVCRKGNDFEVQQFIASIHATPGFAGVREQVKKVKSLFRAEWKRRRPNSSQASVLSIRQRYVQRLPNNGTSLSRLTGRGTVAGALQGMNDTTIERTLMQSSQ